MRQWSAGAPTEYGIEQFTEGDCWILAWALNMRTGCPIIALSENGGETWFHVVARMRPGLYLDVNGPQTRSALQAEWMADGEWFSTQRWQDLEDTMPPAEKDWTYLHSVRRAYRMADRLIAKYELEEWTWR